MTSRRRKRFRLLMWILVCTTMIVGAAAGVYRMNRMQSGPKLPVAPARRGDFLVLVRCRGELTARRSVQITAPVAPDLKIVWLAQPGSAVKHGDPVIRFDSSGASEQLREKEAGLKQAQAGVEQATADAGITAQEDQLELTASAYEVERARLEASKSEIVSKLQGETSRVELGLAEQKLRVQKATVDLHEASGKAKIASFVRQRDQAQSEVEITRQRLAEMEIKAPLDGVIIYISNYSQGWMNAKPFKVGDQVWPGGALAEIPDLASLEMESKLEEIDRGRMALPNDARVHIDSLPELNLEAKLGRVSPLTELNFEWPPTRSFRAYAQIAKPDARLRPGMNGSIDVVIDRIPNAISIPAKALFTRDAKPVVYVAEGGHYHPVQVEVLARNPDEVAIKGLRAGAMVSLTESAKKDITP